MNSLERRVKNLTFFLKFIFGLLLVEKYVENSFLVVCLLPEIFPFSLLKQSLAPCNIYFLSYICLLSIPVCSIRWLILAFYTCSILQEDPTCGFPNELVIDLLQDWMSCGVCHSTDSTPCTYIQEAIYQELRLILISMKMH